MWLDTEYQAEVFTEEEHARAKGENVKRPDGWRYPSREWGDSVPLRSRGVYQSWPKVVKKGQRKGQTIYADNRRSPVWANEGYLAGFSNYLESSPNRF